MSSITELVNYGIMELPPAEGGLFGLRYSGLREALGKVRYLRRSLLLHLLQLSRERCT
jgi:hypothetical protein